MDNTIKEHRIKVGLSQTMLSVMAGVPNSNMNAVERGTREAWPKLRKRLSRVLKVSEDELFPKSTPIHNRIKEYRVKAGLSQTKLGIMAEIACTDMSTVERGKLKAWPLLRKRLVSILGVSEEELFPK